MGTKLKPGQFDCYAKALPDEPLFVLLGRDPSAPERVEAWAYRRAGEIAMGTRPISDMALVREAFQCADAMRMWRRANDGAWRE